MGKIKCIIGCKYRKSNYYFRFPDDKDLQKCWLRMLGKEDLIGTPVKKWAVCEKHITKDAVMAFEKISGINKTIQEEDNHFAGINTNNTASDDMPPINPSTNTSGTQKPLLDDEEIISEKELTPDDQIKDALKTLQGVVEHANSQCFANQSQTSFGAYVENELNLLDRHSVAVAKYFINEILYEATTGEYKGEIDDTMLQSGAVND